MCQIINSQRVTNQRYIPADLITTWDSFCTRHRDVSVNIRLLPGASQCISEACTEIETLYNNMIVETFEQKLLSFLRYKVQTQLPLSVLFQFFTERSLVELISRQYFYQFICQGKPIWPETVDIDVLMETVVHDMCVAWEAGT